VDLIQNADYTEPSESAGVTQTISTMTALWTRLSRRRW